MKLSCILVLLCALISRSAASPSSEPVAHGRAPLVLGIVATSIGLYYGWSARTHWRDAQVLGGCTDDGQCETAAGAVDLAQARQAADRATVLVPVGLGAIALGVVLHVLRDRRPDDEASAIAITASGDGVGLTFELRR